MGITFDDRATKNWLYDRVRVMDQNISAAVLTASSDLVNRTQSELAKNGQHDPITTRSTAPIGSAPMMASGDLRNSVERISQSRIGFGIYEAVVGTKSIYAHVQEKGMQIYARSYMKFIYGGVSYHAAMVEIPPRPFFAPSVEQSVPFIERIFVNAVGRSVI